jgi:hypothetical protein
MCGRMVGSASEVCHHVVHLVCIDGARIPCHAVASLDKVATDLPFGHAANELLPRGLPGGTELNTRLSGVVKKFIVANPEGSIPGLVGCPTVVSGEGGSGHDLGSFGMCKFYRQCRSVAVADVPGCGLALRGREGERATLSERLAIGGRLCHHGVVLLSVGCHDGGKVRCFVHALSMAADGVLWGKWWTVPRLSVPPVVASVDLHPQSSTKHGESDGNDHQESSGEVVVHRFVSLLLFYRVSGGSGRLQCTVRLLSHYGQGGSVPIVGRSTQQSRSV